LLRFSLITIGLGLLIYSVVSIAAGRAWISCPSLATEILLFLSATHIGFFGLVNRHAGTQPGKFVKIYLGSVVLRILSFGVFVFLIIRFDPPSGWHNAVFFLLSYLLFTALEVALLYVAVNRAKPAQIGQKEG